MYAFGRQVFLSSLVSLFRSVSYRLFWLLHYCIALASVGFWLSRGGGWISAPTHQMGGRDSMAVERASCCTLSRQIPKHDKFSSYPFISPLTFYYFFPSSLPFIVPSLLQPLPPRVLQAILLLQPFNPYLLLQHVQSRIPRLLMPSPRFKELHT